jgi:NAD(P)-dependent dehydrogenase (short-subunit alcohol dehydrogenase family)
MSLRAREMRSEEAILVMNIFIPLHQRAPEQVAAVLPTFSALRPLGRNDQPVDAVEALLFLPSDQASFIAGVVLSVEGVMAGRQDRRNTSRSIP